MNIEVMKLHPHIGAEIRGIDLSRPLTEKVADVIKQAFLDHSVILLREQNLSPEKQIEVTEIFGEADIHPLEQFHLPGHPHILVLSNLKNKDGEPLGLEDAGPRWHTDVSFIPKPSSGTLLHALSVPPKGGDTLFAGQYAAWEMLPKEWKDRLEGLRALHGLNRITAPKWTDEQLRTVKPVPHPIIRIHPETGRKALYAGIHVTGIESMNISEAESIINFLYEHCSRAELVYRHTWKKGDLIVWDNRSVLHQATPFDKKYARHMHRTTIIGDRPFG